MTPPLFVKLCFVLDCTGSMDPWIAAAKTKMQTIVADVRDRHPNTIVEVAVVGYRDYGELVRFRVYDFGPAAILQDQMGDLRAEGGDDTAEDIAGAFKRATELSWDPADIRMLFHITDAPAHGLLFHPIHISDRFPQGDPDGLDPRFFLDRWARLGYDYTFVKITSKTDQMLDVFYQTYSQTPNAGLNFHVIDLRRQWYDHALGDPEENMADLLSPAVSRAVTQRISSQEP
jgi:hypothetical protein